MQLIGTQWKVTKRDLVEMISNLMNNLCFRLAKCVM